MRRRLNCLRRRADGRLARFPALGEITGDWGGGHDLAALALWHAARGEDGRGPRTALAPAVARSSLAARHPLLHDALRAAVTASTTAI